MRAAARGLIVAGIVAASAAEARAQTANDTLSFLLTNRSVPTDDFMRDRDAADTTRATIARVLQIELGSVPLGSSASGFTYRHNRSLGTAERTSQSFGPFFVNRSLTLGRRQIAVSVAYQHTAFQALDGRPLRDGTLVATANRFTTEEAPFDVETVGLRIDTRSTAVSAHIGITDRLDIGLTVPFVTLSLDGERVDTYRGDRFVQASASATVTGVSDVLVRGKYNLVRHGGTGLAAGAEVRLPTGDPEELLGAGDATVAPRLTGSVEFSRVALHADAGYVLGGAMRELDVGAAMTVVATPRLTLVGELSGRRLESLGRLVDSVQPHPLLAGIETLRLTSTTEPAQRTVVSAGVKWNAVSSWLLSAYVSRPLTEAGLTAGWGPTVALDYVVAR
jgi:hypothetical protein